MSWFKSHSGMMCDLSNPTTDMVNFDDIAMSLSRQCRFNGHCSEFYSVAQHCVEVSDLLPDGLKVYGLLHDAHEAWTGDIISPLKTLLGGDLALIEDGIDRAIYAAIPLPLPTEEMKFAVKVADLSMLATERRDLMGGGNDNYWDSTPPRAATIIPYMTTAAPQMEWRERLKELTGI